MRFGDAEIGEQQGSGFGLVCIEFLKRLIAGAERTIFRTTAVFSASLFAG
jgi:hypothetical protein